MQKTKILFFYCLLPTAYCLLFLSSSSSAGKLEYRQIHRDNQASHNHTKEGHKRRLYKGHQGVNCLIHLFFVEVCYFAQHCIQGACGFADCYHLHNHGREDLCFSQWVGKCLTLAEGCSCFHYCCLNCLIACCFCNYFKRLKYWDTA